MLPLLTQVDPSEKIIAKLMAHPATGGRRMHSTWPILVAHVGSEGERSGRLSHGGRGELGSVMEEEES
jgi:hypothetical protein